MTGSHDSLFVVLSVLIAALASYAALDLAGRVRSAEGSTRLGWLGGGATVMGLGIWSMHFVAMLAFRLPIPIAYDLPRMLLSVAVAIGASLLALIVVSRAELRPATLTTGGILMGAAIAGMHYIAMASMHVLPAPVAEVVHTGGRIIATDALGNAVVIGTLTMLVLAITGAVIDRTIQAKVEFTRQLTAQTRQLARQYQESQRLAAQLEAMNVELQRSLADAEQAKRELSEQNEANLELQRVAREEGDTARWLAGVAETTAALAHEINNPLTALIMNVELLES